MTDSKPAKRRWPRWAILACAVAGAGVLVALKWDAWLDAATYDVPVRYDQPFGPAIAGADRIVVRADGYNCCRPTDETNLLFVVTAPAEIASVARHLEFVRRTTSNSALETCMCCGGPGVDWYKGKKRIVFTSLQHGHAMRWRGFSTTRRLGFRRGYGDGPLTRASQTWLRQWFRDHGVDSGNEPAGEATEAASEPAPDDVASEER